MGTTDRNKKHLRHPGVRVRPPPVLVQVDYGKGISLSVLGRQYTRIRISSASSVWRVRLRCLPVLVQVDYGEGIMLSLLAQQREATQCDNHIIDRLDMLACERFHRCYAAPSHSMTLCMRHQVIPRNEKPFVCGTKSSNQIIDRLDMLPCERFQRCYAAPSQSTNGLASEHFLYAAPNHLRLG
jgi:hypothetical protein